MSSKLRERRNGLLCFGTEPGKTWVISDPASEELEEAMWKTRYGTPTREQLFMVLSAAEAYIFLTRYPLRGVAKEKFADICRALKEKKDD